MFHFSRIIKSYESKWLAYWSYEIFVELFCYFTYFFAFDKNLKYQKKRNLLENYEYNLSC